MNSIFKLKTTFETEFTADGPKTAYRMSLYAEDDDGDDICIPIDVERLIDPVDARIISVHVNRCLGACDDPILSQTTVDAEQLKAIQSMVAIQNQILIQES